MKRNLILIIIAIIVIAVLGFIFWSSQKSEQGEQTINNQDSYKIVYIDLPDRYSVAMPESLPEVGETKVEMKKDKPEVRLKKWDSEVDLGVSYKKIQAAGSKVVDSNVVEWKVPEQNEELHAYPLEPQSGMEDGGVEIEVILNDKSDTNVFEFQIDGFEDLDFFYQPMTIPEGMEDIFGDGSQIPENIKGSYAVYHKTKRDHLIGDLNYATGKLFHIYRPKAIDADGNEIWGELNYANGILTVTVPQNFLDNAAYPVRVDPTFGYLSIGAYETAAQTADRMRSQKGQPASKGIVTSVSVYGRTGGNNRDIQGALYDGLNSRYGNSGATAQLTSSLGWATSTISVGPWVEANTDYWPAILFDAAAGADAVYWYFDLGSYDTNESTYNNSVTFPTWPTSGNTGLNNVKNTFYATYTAVPEVAAGIIIPWVGTAASIPNGWSRVTALDGEYVKATSTTPTATEYGSSTHTHTSPTHFHSASHNHSNFTSGAAVGNTYGVRGGADEFSEEGHQHTVSLNTASYNNNPASANLSYESNDPPYTEVIWIKSDGTVPGLPESGWGFLHTDSLPTDWDRVSTGKFLKGATGATGGATGGTSNSHTHTDSGHTHTEPSHTHTGSLLIDETRTLGRYSSEKTLVPPHTHALSGGSVVATETSGTGVLANADGQPPFYILNILQNNTGASSTPTGIIAMWDGALGSIPDGWEACDGSGTCPDLSDYFIKGATGDSQVGTTQDTNTHTHSAGASHTHTRNSHTHTFSVGAAVSGDLYVENGTDYYPISADHSHTAATTNCGTSCTTGSATITANANTDNQPLHKGIIFIYYTGVFNNQPTITSVTESSDPIPANQDIYWSVDWADDDQPNEMAKVVVCSSNSITTSTLACAATTYCTSPVYTNRDPEGLCHYTTQVSDIGTLNYYAYVCDDSGQTTACSNPTSGSVAVQEQSPSAPTDLLTQNMPDPIGVYDTTPIFSSVFNDPNINDIADKYCIWVSADPEFGEFTIPHWISDGDSCNTGNAMSNCNQGDRCQDIVYCSVGSCFTLLLNNTTLYWRMWYWDDSGNKSDTSTVASFTMANGGNGVRLKGSNLKGKVRLK